MTKLITIGDSAKDTFVSIHEAQVNCVLNTQACQLCLNYADKIPVSSVVSVPAAGNAANAAIGTCRLENSCAIVTVIGDDEEGRTLYRALECGEVNRSHVQFDKKNGTNIHTILNFKGERTILEFHRPRTYRLPKNLPGADWIYYTSLGKNHQTMEKQLIDYLKTHPKTKLLFNPGTTHLRRGCRSLLPILKHTTILILNKEEASLLLQESDAHPVPNLLHRLHALGPHIPVITDGENGSWALNGKGIYYIPIFPGEAVERTGAGDAYATGFVNALIHEKEIPEAMRWGNANSWSVVRHIGPQKGLLTLKEMKTVLNKFKSIKAKTV
jgi:ribokinase